MAQAPVWLIRAGMLLVQVARHPAMKFGMVVISAIDDLARVINRHGRSGHVA